MMRDGWKRYSAYALVATVLVVLVWLSQERAETASNRLQREKDSIHPASGLVLVDNATVTKPGQALVGMRYRTAASFDELRAHYDTQAKALGWRLCEGSSPDSVTSDGTRFLRAYCREEDQLTLEYYPDQLMERDWNFALDIRWRGPFL